MNPVAGSIVFGVIIIIIGILFLVVSRKREKQYTKYNG